MSNPINVDRAIDVAMKQEELQETITFLSNELGQVKRKAATLDQLLEPVQKKIPTHLNEFIQYHGDQVDLNKLTPVARNRYTKYLEALKRKEKLRNEITDLSVQLASAMGQERTVALRFQGMLNKPAKKQKRVISYECVLNDLKYKSECEEILVCGLPVEMWLEIMKWVTLKELLLLTLLDKRFYLLAGNHPRFKELCTSLSLPPPTAKFNQTYKTVYAISKLGPKRCQKCGLKTTRRPVVDNVVICRYCQPIVAFTKTQAKHLYMVTEQEIATLKGFETGATGCQPRTLLFLKSDVEALAIEKWNGIDGVEAELRKRAARKAKKKEQLPAEVVTKAEDIDLTSDIARSLLEA